MKKQIIIACMVLAGCESVIYPNEVRSADVACAPFGGWRYFSADVVNGNGAVRAQVTAKCNDGTMVTFTLRTVETQK